jgi:hypothetical protein
MHFNIAFTLWNVLSQDQVPELLEKLNSGNLNPDLNISISLLLGKFGHMESVPGLIRAIQYPDNEVRYYAAYALGEIEGDVDTQYLPDLLILLSSGLGEDILRAITAIQAKCKLYNYEIQQENLRKADRASPESADSNRTTNTYHVKELTLMSEQAPIFNQQNATIGLNYAAEGSKPQITQNIQQENPEAALLAIVQIIQTLEKKYTFVQDPQEAIDIIDAEFKELEASRSPQWQNLLNLKRLYNGSKKAALKVGEHFAKENVWGKGFVAFLEGASEDVE